MSLQKFSNMQPQELEAKLLSFKKHLRYIPTKIGEDSADNFIIKFKKFISKLNLNDILANPQEVYQNLLDTLHIDKDTFEDIILLALGVAASWRTITIVKQLSKFTPNGQSQAAIWLNRFTIISTVCSIYMTLIEIYTIKIDAKIKEGAYQYVKDRWQATLDLLKCIKENWYKPWVIVKKFFADYFVKATLKYWEWEWQVGKIDPLKIYHSVFVINWTVNAAWIICSIMLAMELHQADGYRKIIDSILGKAQAKGIA